MIMLMLKSDSGQLTRPSVPAGAQGETLKTDRSVQHSLSATEEKHNGLITKTIVCVCVCVLVCLTSLPVRDFRNSWCFRNTVCFSEELLPDG